MDKQIKGYESAIELIRDYPEWRPVVAAALEEAQHARSNHFAGAWILERAKKYGIQWIPNFRKLVAYGILQKDGESSRGGRRAYYTMPDIKGVEKALREIETVKNMVPYSGHQITDSGVSRLKFVMVPFFGNLASCGNPNDSETFIDDYYKVDTKFIKPGYQYYVVHADGDSMNMVEINDGDLVLVRVQNYPKVGDIVVAHTPEGVTIKEFHLRGHKVLLMPRSDNPVQKPLLLDNVEIQGIVVTTIPK